MLHAIRTHPYRTAGGAVALLAGLAWLAFGYFGVHTLFVDDVVSEAAPVFDTPSPTTPSTAPPTAPPTTPVTTPTTAEPRPTAPSTTAPSTTAPSTTAPATTAPATTAPATTTAQVVTEYVGTFVDDAHPTSGRAVVLGNGTGQRFLRFEQFETDNGPDLNVYLVNSSTGDVSDFVDLGDLTGNIGDQNYEIPVDVDLDVYDRVVIWCVRFGVGFGNATLAAA